MIHLDDQPGPAKPISEAAAARIVAGALARAMPAAAVLTPRRRRWRRWSIGLGLGISLAGAMASAAWLWVKHSADLPSPPVPPVAPQRSRQANKPHSAPLPLPEPPPTAPESPAISPPVPVELPRRRRPRRRHKADPVVERKVIDLLRQASQLRAQRRWREAADTYRRVAGHQRSMRAAPALIAAAELYADHLGNPRLANQLYRKYLGRRPHGALAQEALAGLAQSHAKMGQKARATKSWQTLLRRFPKGVWADRARKALGQETEKGR